MPKQRCRDCLLEITKRAIALSTQEEELQKTLLREITQYIDDNFSEMKLPDISTKIFRKIATKTGTKDPFLSIKRESNHHFVEIIPTVRESLKELPSKEAFKQLLMFSIAANLVDFSTGGHSVDLSAITQQLMQLPKEGLAIDDFEKLFELIERSKTILYLSDNCGEVVIDNLVIAFLVKKMGKKVYLGLKGAPVANDCTVEDFFRDNLENYATETFAVSSAFGWNLHEGSERFKELFTTANLIIAKGQSNYESTLNNLVRYPKQSFPPIFCILRTKCEVITNHLGVPLGSNVIKMMHPLPVTERTLLKEIVD